MTPVAFIPKFLVFVSFMRSQNETSDIEVVSLPQKSQEKTTYSLEVNAYLVSVSVSVANVTSSVFHCLAAVFSPGHNRRLLNTGFLRKLETQEA